MIRNYIISIILLNNISKTHDYILIKLSIDIYLDDEFKYKFNLFSYNISERRFSCMNGLEVINKVYLEKELPAGTTIICNGDTYEVFASRNGFAIRKVSSLSNKLNQAIHNCQFSELLDFMNSDVKIAITVDFKEAIRLNRKMKPIIDDTIDFMSVKDALSYMSYLDDNNLIKTLLEDKVWCVA